MRVIVRKERPHPGAQPRITDVDGNRITAFATNTPRGQFADLELRHRRARCEDWSRGAKDTGLANLPLHDFTQNQIWCALVDQHGARIPEPVHHMITDIVTSPNSVARRIGKTGELLACGPGRIGWDAMARSVGRRAGPGRR
jgi:hypothetical protein